MNIRQIPFRPLDVSGLYFCGLDLLEDELLKFDEILKKDSDNIVLYEPFGQRTT